MEIDHDVPGHDHTSSPLPEAHLAVCSDSSVIGYPADANASCDGLGTMEILRVISTLEAASIPACVVDIAALCYYGALRVMSVCFSPLRPLLLRPL
jgi:hypothetical protein